MKKFEILKALSTEYALTALSSFQIKKFTETACNSYGARDSFLVVNF